MTQLQTMFDKVTVSFQSLDPSPVQIHITNASEKLKKLEEIITKNVRI